MEPLSTALGYEEITLSSGTVKIRQLPIRLLPALLKLMTAGDEPAMVELYCDKPTVLDPAGRRISGWSDELTPAEFTAIIEKGEAINADFFGRWQQRKKKRKDLLPKADLEEAARMFEVISKANPAIVESLVAKFSPSVASQLSGLPSPSSESPSPAS